MKNKMIESVGALVLCQPSKRDCLDIFFSKMMFLISVEAFDDRSRLFTRFLQLKGFSFFLHPSSLFRGIRLMNPLNGCIRFQSDASGPKFRLSWYLCDPH